MNRDKEAKLQELIEAFFVLQVENHACSCDEWPECVHTLNAHDLRKKAIEIEEGK